MTTRGARLGGWTLAALAACAAPDGAPGPGATPDSGVGAGPGGDSGAAVPDDPRVPAETRALEGEAGEARLSGTLPCDAPGPPGFDRVSGGPDWARQPQGIAGEYAGWGVAVADFDGDGHLDIFLPHFGADQLFLGDGALSFTAASERLPGAVHLTYGAAAADLDSDGDPDLVLANDGPNAVLRNDGAGRFTRVGDAQASFGEALGRRTQHLSVGDFDGDGHLDIFGATFFSRIGAASPSDPDPNELYRGRGDGTFEPAHALLTPAGLGTPANAGGFVDSDRDGDADIYVVNDKPSRGFKPQWLENLGGEFRFTTGDQRGRDRGIQGMGLGLGDVNRDGVEDYALSGWNETALLLSSESGWYDGARALNIHPDDERVVGWGLELSDLDADGDLDLLLAHGPDYDPTGEIGGIDLNPERQEWALYEAQPDGSFVEASAAWGLLGAGNRRGFALVDLDGDGFEDVVARDLAGRAEIYRGRCTAGRWLSVTARQPGRANPDAVGALVEVEVDGERWSGALFPATTSLSSSAPPRLRVGLGDRAVVDRITVRWPDGTVSTLDGVDARQTVAFERAPSPMR